MNPFERLRQTIDKLDVNYKYPQDKQNEYNIKKSNIRQNQQSDNKLQLIKQWQQKQTQFIKQINSLSKKIQDITKQLKLSEIQKTQLIDQICKLEKKYQLLSSRTNHEQNQHKNYQDRERKYKEEIFRINSTVQQIGTELTNERINKKNLNSQIAALRDLLKAKEDQKSSLIAQYQDKINSLKEESFEKAKMMEYIIKSNSQERKQSKHDYELLKNENNKANQEKRKQQEKLRIQLYETKLNLQIGLHRQKSLESRVKDLQKQINKETKKNEQKDKILQMNKDQINQNAKIIEALSKEVTLLREQLEYQKNNVKVRVVEIKDQTLDLELEMYKKQCRQLLQEKAILNSVRDSRKTIQPLYSVIDREERTISDRNSSERNLS